MNLFNFIGELFLRVINWIEGLFKPSVSRAKVITQSSGSYISCDPKEALIQNWAEIQAMQRPANVEVNKSTDIPSAQDMKAKADEARRAKIDKQLNTTLSQIMLGVSKCVERGQSEIIFTVNFDEQVMAEVKPILEAKGYKVLRNSITLNWVVRW